MNGPVLIAQLYALRAQLDALVMQVEQEQQSENNIKTSQPATLEPCKHENKVDVSTSGVMRWHCPDCGEIHEEPMNP